MYSTEQHQQPSRTYPPPFNPSTNTSLVAMNPSDALRTSTSALAKHTGSGGVRSQKYAEWKDYDIAVRIWRNHAEEDVDKFKEELSPLDVKWFVPTIELVEKQPFEVREYLRKMSYTAEVTVMQGRIQARTMMLEQQARRIEAEVAAVESTSPEPRRHKKRKGCMVQ